MFSRQFLIIVTLNPTQKELLALLAHNETQEMIERSTSRYVYDLLDVVQWVVLENG